jgi:hypothetical protein
MAEKYVKLVVLLSKKPGMSFEDFKNYYETHHSKLIYLIPRVKRYRRRYLHPIDDPSLTREAPQQQYHVITELWFKDRADFEFAMGRNVDPEVATILAEDEARLFDRSKACLNVVDEYETDLAGADRAGG